MSPSALAERGYAAGRRDGYETGYGAGRASVIVPTASDAPPQMDGTASAGSSTAFARGDHVHPSDSGKADLVNGKVPQSQLPDTGGNFLVVQTLPDAADADPKAIYLVPRSPGESGNIFDEYLRVEPTSGSYAWEKIGSTDIDLSNYVQTTDPRLSDARTPTAHKSSHATGGADALSPADIGAAQASHTHAQAGVTGLPAALDAKLSRAEAEAGYTEWSITPPTYNGKKLVLKWTGYNWNLFYEGDGSNIGGMYGLDIDATSGTIGAGIEWVGDVDLVCTRTRVTPTKTSQLTNDGNGTSNFATLSQIPSVPAISTNIASDAASDAKTASPKAVKTYADAQTLLTPVYGGNGQRFSTWTILRDGVDVTAQVQQPTWQAGYWLVQYSIADTDMPSDIDTQASLTANSITWTALTTSDSDSESIPYTATRVENPVVGYTLGSQSTKQLQPKGNYLTEHQDISGKQDVISDLNTIRSGAAAGETAVQPATLASAIRYDLGTAQNITTASEDDSGAETIYYGEATMLDRTANYVVITAAIDELRIAFPAAVSGKVRDFELRVVVDASESATDIAAPALVLPQGVTPETPDGTMPTIEGAAAGETGVTLLYFSETAAGKFLVKGEAVKEVE